MTPICRGSSPARTERPQSHGSAPGRPPGESSQSTGGSGAAEHGTDGMCQRLAVPVRPPSMALSGPQEVSVLASEAAARPPSPECKTARGARASTQAAGAARSAGAHRAHQQDGRQYVGRSSRRSHLRRRHGGRAGRSRDHAQSGLRPAAPPGDAGRVRGVLVDSRPSVTRWRTSRHHGAAGRRCDRVSSSMPAPYR